MSKPVVSFRDLGHAPYKETWDFQEELFERNVQRKLQNRVLVQTGNTRNRTTRVTRLACQLQSLWTTECGRWADLSGFDTINAL